MKKRLSGIPLSLFVVLLVFAAGCNMVDSPAPDLSKSKIVLRDKFCVRFDEDRDSGKFEKEIVCDQFAAMIHQWLEDNNVDGDDITHIFMTGGRITEGDDFKGPHGWDITSSVYIKRADIKDGPRRFIKNRTVDIPDDIDGRGFRPRFDRKGVKLVNRALRDLVDGGDPVLVVKMVSTDVDPEPSSSDPLIFSWDACINITAIVQRGDDDDNDSDSDDDSSN